ncbi:DUF308 domain-containing protein [Marinospirillum perlucidum]|uniref:DUF308 domain-containing protein n=1 Tax=Marinospirillum perlucidum TaxID=1982602 RepID=UPI00138FCC60|nr:DUF308 domain-containing protein [Marinospirillum perlucidum]
MSEPINELEVQTRDLLTSEIKNHRSWFTGLGIVFLLLGVAAVTFPWVATLSVDIILGTLLMIAGLAQIFHSFSIPRWRGTLLSLGLSGLGLLTGILMLLFPLAGVVTLTLLVTVFFLLSGTAKTFFAFRIRPAVGWGWTLVSGLSSLGLALLILFQFNEVLPWVLGLLLGIDLIISSVWMLALASSAKKG